MYPLKYVADDSGLAVSMGRGTSYTITDVEGLDGIETTIETSQGFEQVGETIDARTTGGNYIKITGKISPFKKSYGDALVNALPPLSDGRLYFNSKYWVDVTVKNSPLIAQSLKMATFNFRLFAPYPYWRSATKSTYKLGALLGGFRFPVNFATSHHFGQRSASLFVNCINNGNVKSDFLLTLYARGSVSNITITNAQTQEFIGINADMETGDYIYMYREDNLLRCTRMRNNVEEDIFSSVDEDTDLFFMNVGNNIIRAEADSGGSNLVVQIDFYEPRSGVFYGC